MLKFFKPVALISILFLSGCAPQGPQQIFDLDAYVAEWECKGGINGVKDGATGKIADLYACPLHATPLLAAFSGDYDTSTAADPARVAQRFMFIIDLQYRSYENDLLTNDRNVRTVPALAAIILPIAGLAGNVSGTELGAAQILTNLYTTYESQVLASSTYELVTARMRADRAATRDAVERKLKSFEDDPTKNPYSVSEVMRDMEAYIRAGTIQNAINNLTTNITGTSAVEGK